MENTKSKSSITRTLTGIAQWVLELGLMCISADKS